MKKDKLTIFLLSCFYSLSFLFFIVICFLHCHLFSLLSFVFFTVICFLYCNFFSSQSFVFFIVICFLHCYLTNKKICRIRNVLGKFVRDHRWDAKSVIRGPFFSFPECYVKDLLSIWLPYWFLSNSTNFGKVKKGKALGRTKNLISLLISQSLIKRNLLH